MNMYRKLKPIMLFAMCGLVTNVAMAQLLSSGTWNATTISSSQTVSLTGNISAKGLITIKNGATLTIQPSTTDTNYYINVNANLSNGLFFVEKGGKLVINGSSKDFRIYIDGGANYEEDVEYNEDGFLDDARLLKKKAEGTSYYIKLPLFRNSGNLELTNVFVRNANNTSTDGADRYGAAIRHQGQEGTVKTTLKNCVIRRCKANVAAGVMMFSKSVGTVTLEDCEFSDCVNTETSTGTSTGTIRSWGDTKANLNMFNVKVHHCYSYLSGGGVYINASGAANTMATISGCELYNNYCEENGGGFNGGGNFTFNGEHGQTKIYHNYAKNAGGGICFYGYSGGAAPSSAVHVTETLDSSVEVYDNEAENGGGICFFSNNKITLPTGSTYKLSVEGANIHDNRASNNGGGIWYNNGYTGNKYSFSAEIKTGSIIKDNEAIENGGGVYMYMAPITISGGTIQKNESKNGAGVYITGGGGNVTISGGLIDENTVSIDGGGIYSAGGTVNISNATVSGNHADNGNGGGLYSAAGITVGTTATGSGATVSGNHARNGAGFYVAQASGTTTTIQGGSTISDNIATEDGAGAYIASGNLSILFSDINENEATRNGGGIYAGASSVVTMSDGDIADNQAKNGGGIYLATGTNMTMNNGLIRYNKAVSAEGATLFTAYQAGSDPDIQGVGGGIYLSAGTDSKDTKLTFELPKTVGIYGNTATLGADEIFADGLHTQITVPHVEGMNLKDYPAKADGWYEDYITDDTHYTDGTNIAPAGTPVRRYEDYIANGENPYLVGNETASEANKYICLRLGCTTSLIITKSGMTKGETAIFKVFKTSAEIQKILYTVSITAGNDGSGNVTIKGIPMGEYTVQETDWSWAYTPDPSDGKITQDISKNNTFTFTNTPKENVPLHGEDFEKNVFGTSANK